MDIKELIRQNLPDNTEGLISPEKLRSTLESMVDNNITEFSSLSKISALLHKVSYDKLDYAYAREFFRENKMTPERFGACSAVRKGDFVGRNFDWYAPLDFDENGEPTFFVHTAKTNDFKEVNGIAYCPGLTEKIAKNHEASELWKILPFYLKDGFNGSLFACINVVPNDKGHTIGTIPTSTKEDEISARMIVRYVLDRFDNALEAIQYLQEHVSIYADESLYQMNYELHMLIADAGSTYIVEFVDNQLVYTEHNIMTNFFIHGVEFLENGKVYTNADAADGNLPSSLGITDFGSGLERYNKIVESTDDMRVLMNSIKYSKAYDLDETPYWYSEFVYDKLNVTVDTLPTDENMQLMIETAQKIKRGELEGRLWITAHSIVYNLKTGTMNLISFEDGQEIELMPTSEKGVWEKGAGEKSVQTSGTDCHADADYSVAEGWDCRTIVDEATNRSGIYAHAEGSGTAALGKSSHTEGVATVTNNEAEHAEGRGNVSHYNSDNFGDPQNTLHSVGMGSASNLSQRKNAYEVMQNGDMYIFGIGGYDGTNPQTAESLQHHIGKKSL